MIFLMILLTMFGETMIRGSFNGDKIDRFVQKYTKTTLSKIDYRASIERGKEIFNTLFEHGMPALSFDRVSYLNDIIALMWYFYAIAIQKDQGFTSGVIVLEDKDQKLYNLLFNYVKQVNPKQLLRRSLISKNPYGYSRRSTHFREDQRNFIQYGIDIRFSPNQKAQPLLPALRTHILFGRLHQGLTFIKFERHGLYYKDGFVGHAFGFLSHVLNRTASRFVTLKERPLERKEHMPEWVKRECRMLELNMARIKKIKDIVAARYKDPKIQPLIEKLAQRYDHLEMRYGAEVILDRNEMDAFAIES